MRFRANKMTKNGDNHFLFILCKTLNKILVYSIMPRKSFPSLPFICISLKSNKSASSHLLTEKIVIATTETYG